MWPEGTINQEPFPHVGDIVKEILPPIEKTGVMNGTGAENFDDARKLAIVENEPRIKLLTNSRAIGVEMAGELIGAVVIQNTVTARQQRLKAKLFADCTGDAVVGYLAGADYEYEIDQLMGSTNLFSVLDASDEKQVLKCECKDKSALAMQYEKGDYEQPFPRCPWALDLSDKPFPGRGKFSKNGKDELSQFDRKWYWESGFDKDQVNDIELIRDHNFRAVYGAWDALKNVDQLYPNHRLGWVAFIAGKRESRRLMGDVVLDGQDFIRRSRVSRPGLPLFVAHRPSLSREGLPRGVRRQRVHFRLHSRQGLHYGKVYWAPYRCLYSRNVDNLFMAGRDISVTKTGLGPVRVMRTCGMMGEIVGKAASICVREQTTPRGVYQSHLDSLQDLMKQPGATRVA